jgi:hypothetical protein
MSKLNKCQWQIDDILTYSSAIYTHASANIFGVSMQPCIYNTYFLFHLTTMSGAGKTPYSRGGDGRAALSNAAREFFAWHGCNGRFHRYGGNIIRDKWDITNQFDMIFGSAWGLSPPNGNSWRENDDSPDFFWRYTNSFDVGLGFQHVSTMKPYEKLWQNWFQKSKRNYSYI